MKSFILALVLGFSANFLQAQGTGEEAKIDSTEISVGNRIIFITKEGDEKSEVKIITKEGDEKSAVKIIVKDKDKAGEHQDWSSHDGDGDKKKKKFKTFDVDFVALDLNMSYLTQDGDFNLGGDAVLFETKPLNSVDLTLHFAKTRINLIRKKVNLVTAISLASNRYAFRKDLVMVPDQENVTVYVDSLNDYRKSKLMTNYLQIPLLLNIQTNPNRKSRNFSISAGGYAGLLIHSSTKRKGESIGKIRKKDDFNLNQMRYGLTGRVGFAGLELFCNYSLTNFFAEGEGPELTPVTFGISLTGIM